MVLYSLIVLMCSLTHSLTHTRGVRTRTHSSRRTELSHPDGRHLPPRFPAEAASRVVYRPVGRPYAWVFTASWTLIIASLCHSAVEHQLQSIANHCSVISMQHVATRADKNSQLQQQDHIRQEAKLSLG